MKKHFIFLPLIILIAISAIIYFNSNEKLTIINKKDTIKSITIDGITYKEEPTLSRLIDVLNNYDTQKMDNPFPRTELPTETDIHYVDNRQIVHITLGTVNFIYASSNQFFYEIMDSDDLQAQINRILTTE